MASALQIDFQVAGQLPWHAVSVKRDGFAANEIAPSGVLSATCNNCER
jgi:hypothetical protein